MCAACFPSSYPSMNDFHGEQRFSHSAFAWMAVLSIWFSYQLAGLFLGQALGINESSPLLALLQGVSQLGFMFVPTLLLMRLSPLGYSGLLRIKSESLNARVWALVCVGLVATEAFDVGWTSIQHSLLPQATLDFFSWLDKIQEGMITNIMGPSDWINIIRSIIIVALIPALSEETLIRGLMQRSLEETQTPIAALMGTSLFFSVAHFNPEHLVSLFFISIVLGSLAYSTKSLIPGIVLHFANNLVAVIGYHSASAIERSQTSYLDLPLAGILVALGLGSLFFILRILRRSDTSALTE